jgi:hypothetical protein
MLMKSTKFLTTLPRNYSINEGPFKQLNGLFCFIEAPYEFDCTSCSNATKQLRCKAIFNAI